MTQKKYCPKCQKTMTVINFYKTRNLEKYPDGYLDECKNCVSMHVDNYDPDTYKWILEEIDVPYIPSLWNQKLLKKTSTPELAAKMGPMTIIGDYLATVRMVQWKKYSYKDSEMLEEEQREMKRTALAKTGMTEEEIEEELNRTPERVDAASIKAGLKSGGAGSSTNASSAIIAPADTSIPYLPTIDDDLEQKYEESIRSNMTDEEKLEMRQKWGRGYTPQQWVALEKLYREMMASYDIRDASSKNSLIMICKASLKTNELMDAGDIDAAKKIAAVYESLLKSAKLTAAQAKEEDSEGIDSVGELVYLCEKEGFIPRYYTDGPKDHIDRTIQDMQTYTRDLVTKELNLGNLMEQSMNDIEADRKREAEIVTDDGNSNEDEILEKRLFGPALSEELSDEDLIEFSEFIDRQASEDAEEVNEDAE